MNPPYGRVRLSAAARERWQSTLYGHANRYGLFLHAAVERVKPGGVVAAIIPTSFLGGAYFQRLRAFLAREAPLVRLAFVDTRAGVFAADVLQETCLAILQKAAGSRGVTCSQVTVMEPPFVSSFLKLFCLGRLRTGRGCCPGHPVTAG